MRLRRSVRYTKSRCKENTPNFYHVHLRDDTKIANFVCIKPHRIEQINLYGEKNKSPRPVKLSIDANHILTHTRCNRPAGGDTLYCGYSVLCVNM